MTRRFRIGLFWVADAGWGRVLACLLLLTGCAAPIGVSGVDPGRKPSALSEPARIVLNREDLAATFRIDPEGALRALHAQVSAGPDAPDLLFALAELSAAHAAASRKPSYHLAAAVYAFAFLFPDDAGQRPSALDPRLQRAAEIYGAGLTAALSSGNQGRLDMRGGRYALPFGHIDIRPGPGTARWNGLVLSEFVAADALRLRGLRNRYRQPGLGAAVAALASEPVRDKDFPLVPGLHVPGTVILRVDRALSGLAAGQAQGVLEAYPADEPASLAIQGQAVPLHWDTTAAIALSLRDPAIWNGELNGFFRADPEDRPGTRLVGLQPYHPGRIPIVFIHGTASSSGRWADLINDLGGDPVIRANFQLWSFSYPSGAPIPFSALDLRTALDAALHRLDPQGKDPALHRMVLIGHSQGGLLAKMMVVDSGDRLWDAVAGQPFERLQLSPGTRDLVRRAMFVRPLPDVRRVVFIATPHRGSFVAASFVGRFFGSLISLPAKLATAAAEVTSGNAQALRSGMEQLRFDSVGAMSPENPALQALAASPVSPGVAAHSIIAVDGNGPVETGDDGVVAYSSAHVEGVESELVVRSGHSVQGNPATVREVRRILLRHLAAAGGPT